MNRLLKSFLSLVILLLLNSPCDAGARESGGFNAYVAAGPNFIFPTSVRVGYGAWELGLLSKGFIGFDKVFPISTDSFYSIFGFGLTTESAQTSPGIQVGFGFNYEVLWQLSVRGELVAVACINGYMISHGLLGVAYGF